MLHMLNPVMPIYFTEIICIELTMSDSEFQFEMFKWISTVKIGVIFFFHVDKYVSVLVCKTMQWVGKFSLGSIFNDQFSLTWYVVNGELYVVSVMM